jgi:hypothetical protein
MLSQTYSWPKPRLQYAFKDSMVHGILQSVGSAMCSRTWLGACGMPFTTITYKHAGTS